MNDEGVVLPRRTRRVQTGGFNPGGAETPKEKAARIKRENDEWAARSGPVIVKKKGKSND